jgi:hypothetical protein
MAHVGSNPEIIKSRTEDTNLVKGILQLADGERLFDMRTPVTTRTYMLDDVPVAVTEDVVIGVLDHIIAGLSLAKALSLVPGAPSNGDWLRALRQQPDLARAYELAVCARADALADKMIDIADEEPRLRADGSVDSGHETWRKTRLTTYQWVAEITNPMRYTKQVRVGGGDKPIEVVQSTDIDVRGLTMEEIDTLMTIIAKTRSLSGARVVEQERA